jgi:hypothetical protein
LGVAFAHVGNIAFEAFTVGGDLLWRALELR